MDLKPQNDSQNELPTRLLDLPMYLMLILSRIGYRNAVQSKIKFRMPEYAVMATLEEFGPSNQQALAQRVGFDKSDVTKIINNLEAAGFLSRKEDHEDRRRYWVNLTTSGKRQLEHAEREITETMKSFLGGLSSSEYKMLQKLLLKALAKHDSRFQRT
ncbi:MAG: MarR family transcriptional regulator [Bdellovibrionales bacterium]|nr:MarR family transcriptional regulator [Bdellovibrionales bacterium]